MGTVLEDVTRHQDNKLLINENDSIFWNTWASSDTSSKLQSFTKSNAITLQKGQNGSSKMFN
jgi:hypothetical protein